MYICLCKAVTEKQIKDAIKSGAKCFSELQNELGVSTQCGKCKPEIHDCLQEALIDDTNTPYLFCLPVLPKQT